MGNSWRILAPSEVSTKSGEVHSLGACAGYFVLEFCQARSLPTLGITLRQRMEFDDAHVLRAIELEIEVPPAFPGKYRQALARAAEGCSVKKAIDAQPRFSVRTFSPAPAPLREAGHV